MEKLLLRAQNILQKTYGVELSILSLQKIKNATLPGKKLDEDNFDKWLQGIAGLPQMQVPNANEFFENLELKSTETPGFVLTDEDFEAVLEQSELGFSEQEVKKILSTMKRNFDSKDACLEAIVAAVDNYIRQQAQQRNEIIAQSKARVEDDLNASADLMQSLTAELSQYKEQNASLVSSSKRITEEYLKLRQVKNGMLITFGITILIAVVAIPLALRNREQIYQQHLQEVCEAGQISNKLCK